MKALITFMAGFLLTVASGLVVVWADVSTWGSGDAGMIMACTFLCAFIVGTIAACAREGLE